MHSDTLFYLKVSQIQDIVGQFNNHLSIQTIPKANQRALRIALADESQQIVTF